MSGPAKSRARVAGLRPWLLLAAILAAALGVRLISLSREAVWYDEVMLLLPLDSPNVVEYLRNAIPRTPAPPGFMITEYFWSRLVGTEVIALRLWPVLCGLASIAVLFQLARRLFGVRAALVSALWLSLIYWHIHFSQEIRYYPLSSLLALLSMWCFVEWAASPRRAWLGLHLAMNACMVWTHPLTAFLCVAQAIFLVLYRRTRLRALGVWFGVHAALALSLVAYVASLDQQAASAQAAWIPTPTLWGRSPSLYNFLSMAAGVIPLPPTNGLGRALLPVQGWSGAALVLLHLVGAFAGLHGLLRRHAAPDSPASALNPRETAILLALWFVVPPLLVYTLSHYWRPMFIVRYVLFASFPLYLLLGHALAARPRGLLAAALALLLAHDALFYFPGPMRAPFDRVAESIQERTRNAPIIVVDDMLFAAPLEYYWRRGKPAVVPWIDKEKLMEAGGYDLWLVFSDERRVARAMDDAAERGAVADVRHFQAGRPLWVIHVRSDK